MLLKLQSRLYGERLHHSGPRHRRAEGRKQLRLLLQIQSQMTPSTSLAKAGRKAHAFNLISRQDLASTSGIAKETGQSSDSLPRHSTIGFNLSSSRKIHTQMPGSNTRPSLEAVSSLSSLQPWKSRILLRDGSQSTMTSFLPEPDWLSSLRLTTKVFYPTSSCLPT